LVGVVLFHIPQTAGMEEAQAL